MDMSAACEAPRHAPISTQDKQHARFNEYLSYRSAMSVQLVECQPFASWLREQEEFEQGRVTVFQAGPKCNPEVFTPGSWYIGHTPPRSRKYRSYGPYATEAAAQRDAAQFAGVKA